MPPQYSIWVLTVFPGLPACQLTTQARVMLRWRTLLPLSLLAGGTGSGRLVGCFAALPFLPLLARWPLGSLHSPISALDYTLTTGLSAHSLSCCRCWHIVDHLALCTPPPPARRLFPFVQWEILLASCLQHCCTCNWSQSTVGLWLLPGHHSSIVPDLCCGQVKTNLVIKEVRNDIHTHIRTHTKTYLTLTHQCKSWPAGEKGGRNYHGWAQYETVVPNVKTDWHARW